MTKSKQARWDDGAGDGYVGYVWDSLREYIKECGFEIPARTPDTRDRDRYLSDFWRREPMLAGVMNSAVAIDKNRGWTLVGGRNQVARFEKILRNVDDGSGWRQYMSRQAEAFYSTNMGALTEIGRDTRYGPLAALWSVDPTICYLSGNKLCYQPEGKKKQEWPNDLWFRCMSLPDIREKYANAGFCAVDRCYSLAVTMVAVGQHDKEKLLAVMPKGLLTMQGISERQWQKTMEANQAKLTAKEREFFAGLFIFFSDQPMEVKLTAISSLPDGFDKKTWTDLLMFGYALCFGYDPSEFWPVQFGALGRGAEAEVQAVKATGKGGLDFVLSYQDNLQNVLPQTLHFEFEQRNEAGELIEAQLAKAWAEAVNEMATPSGVGLEPTLTNDEKRQLLAQRGLIPDSWTEQEEEVKATDTESIERYLDYARVRSAITRFPEEPIVAYTWPSGVERVVFSPGQQRPYYSIRGL